jgi:hypothetical protein
VSDSYYELLDVDATAGERFTATDLVRSTWSATIQHGAPVSALLARAMERCAPREDTRLSRVMVDLLGGVPADGDLLVRARVDRPGRQIELVSAEMLAQGPDGRPRAVARASGWRLSTLDTTPVMHDPAPALRPLADAVSRDMAKDWDRSYVHSIDWRWLTEPLADGPGESWLRATVDLVKGETVTPLNTDLVVHVHRLPEGEWIGIRAETSYGPDGIGATFGTLFDSVGAIGGIAQSVLVRPLPPRG